MLTDGFVVQNLAHQEQCIRSKHASIRILGAFATREEAEAFVQEWTLEQPDLETRVSPMNHWRVVSKSLWDLETQKDSFQKRWALQLEDREKEFKDVEFRAAHKIAGPVRAEKSEDAFETTSPEKKVSQSAPSEKTFVPRVTKKLEVISQKFVGLAILQDSDDLSFHDQEPFFQVLCVGDNEAELEAFLKTQSQEQVDTHGIFSSVPLAVVTMQDFVPLSKIATVRTRRFSPNQSLEEIRSGFTFENKDGGPNHSGMEGVAQDANRTESDANVSEA